MTTTHASHPIRSLMAAAQETMDAMKKSGHDDAPLCSDCFARDAGRESLWKLEGALDAVKESPEADKLDYLQGYLAGFESGRRSVRTTFTTDRTVQPGADPQGEGRRKQLIADLEKHPVRLLLDAAEETYWAIWQATEAFSPCPDCLSSAMADLVSKLDVALSAIQIVSSRPTAEYQQGHAEGAETGKSFGLKYPEWNMATA